MIGAALSVVGTAMAPFKDSLLEKWAASVNLGPNVKALELELLAVQALLEPAIGKEIVDNSALKKLLVILQELGYDAEDVLDELDYFRIQDELDNTSDTAEKHAKSCAHNLAFHAKAVGKQICLPACLFATNAGAERKTNWRFNGCKPKLSSRACCNASHVVGKCFPCSSLPCVLNEDDDNDGRSMRNTPPRNHRDKEPPKLRFNRVDASKKMQHIVEQLRIVRGIVSSTITTLGPNWTTASNIEQSRPMTTSELSEPELYGRGLMMNSIIHDITEGKHAGDLLTVIPIVGPGGIGKTTLAQHIYHNEKVQKHFEVKVWKCVSLKFNANNLIEEIKKHIPQVNGENSTSTAGELIGQRLKDRRFLLVLDDIWDCSETGWQQLLVPFKKSQAQGNIIIVTTRLTSQAQIMIQNIDRPITLQGLEHDKFMELFLAIVFGNEKFGEIHTFFIETGEAIARKLKGSPLAAKTVGDISNLVKLRRFLVESYSSIAEVGKLKSLQELRRFEVKQECRGFELRQIGDLVELCGSLCIAGLENVQITEEADEAKLIQKKRLQELILCWDRQRPTNNDSAIEEHVLERLKPSSNLQNLSIIGNKGDNYPSWLGTSLSVKNLEYLCLDDVAWKTFPAIGELCLVNVSGEEIPNIMQEKRFNIMPEKRFENLKRLELMELPQLNRWAVHAPCQLFPFLEVIEIRYCSNLVELSFSHSACCRQEKLANGNLFPNKLSSLKIDSCHQLSSFPTPLPWINEATCYIDMKDIGSPCLQKLNFHSEDSLTIEGKDNPDSTFWNVLAFHNLTKLKEFDIRGCPPPQLHHLQMLSSLRKLCMPCSSKAFPFVDGDSHFKYQLPVEELNIEKWSASGKELTQLLTYFPKLSELMLWHCENISGLGVMGQQPMETPGPSSSAKKLDEQCQQQDDLIVLEQDGLFLLPPQLQVLWIYDCPKLSLCSNPHDDNKEEGRTGGGGGGGGGGGLQGSSLRRLSINSLPNFLSSYSSSAVYSFLFPNSLENLILLNEVGMETLPLSNLSSLTRLDIEGCGDLRGKGLLSLLAQGCLTELIVKGTPNFFVDSDISQVHEQEFPSYSSKLQLLSTDDVAGVTAAPICRLLVSSLTKLSIWDDKVVERFTEEQEILLFANSLEEIMFSYCDNLQYLPAWLHRLPNLKRLLIDGCKSIQMLPKGSLPSSLQELQIKYCPKIRSLPEEGLPSSVQVLEIWDCPKIGSLTKDGLPSSLQKLVIFECPGIQSLPKVDDLPSSLRELDIMRCGNEELKRQCRRLIGIIPIVKA
ncbi:hypothetical protein HU200_008743 [Digitaria exilis]|uniref:AAA+ ATPase domain-containing protein n=1 Tax=Digitaria exilis TaxID=1010633 RepID=A0A835KPR4_9POAL|nr:hypothetical protein HU200_008743 [Digitaria exilis]